MALKNVNVFEQHVEKMVLAVAAVGAVFMGYMAVQTVSLPDHPEIGPKNIEDEFGKAIKRLDAKRDALPAPEPAVPDLVAKYRGMASGQPLDPALVNAKLPEFAPRNLAPRKMDDVPHDQVASVVPDPVKPELLHAEALQLQVCTNPQVDPVSGQVVPPPAGMQLPTVTKNVVAIDGFIPVGKFQLDMLKETNPNKRFTPDVQRGVVYRVNVFRQELQANGSYSKPERVTPAKGAPAPSELLPTTMPEGELPAHLTDIDGQFQIIQLPNYYVDAQGQPVQPPILTRPEPQSILDETARLHSDLQAAQMGAAAGGGFRPITTPVQPGAVAGAAAPTTLPSAPDQLKALEVQPFTFWDDSVQPNHTYRYSVQVQLVNPGFGWKWGLEKKDLKLVPVLAADPAAVPNTVSIHSDMDFFVQGTETVGKGIYGQIFKQVSGRWYSATFSADRGTNIQTSMKTGGDQAENVDTKFTVVDYPEGRTPDNKATVILKDPTGNLVSRDANEDWNRPGRGELTQKVLQGGATTSTAPASGTVTVPTTNRTPPTPTPTSRPRGGPPVNGGR